MCSRSPRWACSSSITWDLSVLAPLCAEFRQWSFLCVIAPLRLSVATGSPVNPIAIL
jgi:hypothetical protein